MKNLRYYLLSITVILLISTFACTSPVKKQTNEEAIESSEEFEVDSANYFEDTTLYDDEAVMEETDEEEEN